MSNSSKVRPCSLQKIDDWMSNGYAHQSTDRAAACEAWWKAWCGLLTRLRPETDTMLAAEALCRDRFSVFNWSQSFMEELWNLSLRDPQWFPVGERYCREWLAQFRAEMPDLQVTFRSTWADFTFKVGRVSEAMAILEQTLADWPNQCGSYVALADAHSHLFADRQHHPPFDPEKAAQILKLGLARLPRPDDQRCLRSRLDDLRDAIPVSQKAYPVEL